MTVIENNVENSVDQAIEQSAEQVIDQAGEQPAEQAVEKKPSTSRPVIRKQVTLKTFQMQRLKEKHCKAIQDSLFQLDMVLPVLFRKEPKVIQLIESNLQDHLNQVAMNIENQMARLFEMIESNGISPEIVKSIDYSNPCSYVIHVHTPKGGKYVNLLERIDELYHYIDALYMNDLITVEYRNQSFAYWFNTMNKFSNKTLRYYRICFKRLEQVRNGEVEELSDLIEYFGLEKEKSKESVKNFDDLSGADENEEKVEEKN